LDEHNEASDSSRERHREPKHNRRTTTRAREENHARSISAHPSDEEEDFVQETPEAALVAAQAYLLTTQPEPGDLREHMHQAAIKSLRVSRRQTKETFSREEVDTLRGQGKEKHKVPILAKPNK
jgi:hypothetical protein